MSDTEAGFEVFTMRVGYTPRVEWGYRYRDGSGTFGPVAEVEARLVASKQPATFELVRRVLEVPDWTEVS